MLVLRHRAALRITNFIRSVINQKRRGRHLPLMKLTVAQSPLKGLRHKRRIKGRGEPLFSSASKSKEAKLAVDDEEDSRSFSSVVSEKSLGTRSSEKSPLSMSSAMKEEIAMENEVDQLLTVEDELGRRRWEKSRALSLVQRVNEGKFVKDTVYQSRLIPVKEVRNEGTGSRMKVKAFSVKERAFLSVTNRAAGEVAGLKSSFDVYTGGPTRLYSTKPPPVSMTRTRTRTVGSASDAGEDSARGRVAALLGELQAKRAQRLLITARDGEDGVGGGGGGEDAEGDGAQAATVGSSSHPLAIEGGEHSVLRSFNDIRSFRAEPEPVTDHHASMTESDRLPFLSKYW